MSTFTRNFQEVDSRPYDLCVIGGGIVGLSVAEDAARRGLSVLLCEAKDFSAETSAGCFRLVHGGMRYLQHLDFGRMFDSVKEQTILRKRAPHLIRPVSFVLPCYGHGKEGRWFLELGMSLYELLTPVRNNPAGVWGRLQRHNFLSRDAVLSQFPGLSPARLSGGIRMWDCQMSSPDRISLAVARSAAGVGAKILNYASVVRIEKAEGADASWLLSVRDQIAGLERRISAKVVVNATGPWASDLIRKSFGEGALSNAAELRRPVLSKGFQLVLPPVLEQAALAISSRQEDPTSTLRRGKRSYFLVPWNGYTLAGTTDEAYEGEASAFSVTRSDVERFLSELREGYRSPLFHLENVLQTFGGLLPTETLDQGMRILKDDILVDHAQSEQALPCFLSVVAVKYTTFRGLAEKVVNAVQEKLGRERGSCSTSEAPLFGGKLGDKEILTSQLEKEFSPPSRKMIENLLSVYGSETAEIFALAKGISTQLSEDTLLTAQVRYALEQEMALSLSDIVFRRTSLGAGAKPSPQVLKTVATICQEKLNWNESQMLSEVKSIQEDRRFSFCNDGER